MNETEIAALVAKLSQTLRGAESDLVLNAPLPPPETMTAADALAALEAAQAKAAAFSAWMIAHPGVYWALRRVLTALAAMRIGWATEALAGLKATPGALATATIWLPRLTGFLKMTQPAPTWEPGPGPYRGR